MDTHIARKGKRFAKYSNSQRSFNLSCPPFVTGGLSAQTRQVNALWVAVSNLLDDWPSSSAFKLSATDRAHFLTADTTIVLSRAVTTVTSSIERACGCWLNVQESSLTRPSAFISTFYLVLYQFALLFYPSILRTGRYPWREAV